MSASLFSQLRNANLSSDPTGLPSTARCRIAFLPMNSPIQLDGNGGRAVNINSDTAVELLIESLEECVTLLELHETEFMEELLTVPASLRVCSLKAQQIVDQFFCGLKKVASRTDGDSVFVEFFTASNDVLRTFAHSTNLALGVRLGRPLDETLPTVECEVRLKGAASLANIARKEILITLAKASDWLSTEHDGRPKQAQSC